MQNESQILSISQISKQVFCSFGANMVGLAIGHPIETLKVRFQTNQKTVKKMLMEVIKKEGVLGLYKGFSLPFLTYMPYYTLCFTLTNIFQKNLPIQNNETLKAALSGTLAGIIGMLVYHPADFLKTKAQIQIGHNLIIRKEIQNIYLKKGLLGLYKGFWITFLREIPGWAAYFGTYEYMKENNFNQFICGGSAGFMAWVFVFQFDIIKTKIQQSELDLKIKTVAKQIYQERGFKGFFKGAPLLILRGILVNSIVLPLYDSLGQLIL